MDIKQKKFRFVSSAFKPETFEVLSFTGSEGLSKLYRFEILLISDNPELDLEKIINSRATLTILRDTGNIDFHGILVSFEQMLSVNKQSQYRAVLTPLMWRLTLTHHNQVFLDSTVPQIIESALKDGGLNNGLDFELRLTKTYPTREYVCMYNESHYNFVTRWMEREGIYFYFEQDADREKMIITDTGVVHSFMKEGDKMIFSPVSGLDDVSREEVIKTLVCVQKALPAQVMLKDYNYRKPSLELSAVQQVSDKGIGDVYIYGEHFSTPEEGAALAKVRAEELKCRARTFHGESLIPFLRPGYTFLLSEHFRKDFNVRYLTTDIEHNGNQAFFFSAGLGQTTSEREETSYYRNSFASILNDSQFRPERVTEKPRMPGTINAHIDAEGNGQYAELDKQGRYKVRLPFDLSNSRGGKASSWLRMAQPYAGSSHGMHFPLHKGTEVLLTFIDGDPDRPIIAAAVTNPLTPSPVTEYNQTNNIIRSAADNRMEMEDEIGSERVRFSTPFKNTFLHMGSPPLPGANSLGAAVNINTDVSEDFVLSSDGTGKIHTGKEMTIEAKKAATDATNNASITIDADKFMENRVGGVSTPDTTATFFNAAAGTVAKPSEGDYYLTTKGKYVLNVGSSANKSDLIVQVSQNYSEIIAGTKNIHVTGNAYETYDGDLTQNITGKLTQKYTKDAWKEYKGDEFSLSYGFKHSVFLGEQLDVNSGAFNAFYGAERMQLHVGSNTMINVINANTINMGLIMSFMLAFKIDYEKSMGIKLGMVKVDQHWLKSYTTKVKAGNVDVHAGTGKIKTYLAGLWSVA